MHIRDRFAKNAVDRVFNLDLLSFFMAIKIQISIFVLFFGIYCPFRRPYNKTTNLKHHTIIFAENRLAVALTIIRRKKPYSDLNIFCCRTFLQVT